jgi:hypothetical protein
VYDSVTRTKTHIETTTPIIELVRDEGIRTLDKYGKCTVIIEEN